MSIRPWALSSKTAALSPDALAATLGAPPLYHAVLQCVTWR
jgi:hypothetical protein